MVDRGANRRLLDGELCEGGPHEHVSAHVDEHALPRPLIQHPELGVPGHRILRA